MTSEVFPFSTLPVFFIQPLVQRLALHLRLRLLRQPRRQLVRRGGDLIAQLQVIEEAFLIDIAGFDSLTLIDSQRSKPR